MIVVTGGGGVLGQALRTMLAQGDEEVVTLQSSDIDLRDREACLDAIAAKAPRLIYHLAGNVHGLGGNSRYPADIFSDNVRINTNVIDAARLGRCAKIVAASTVAIYSSAASLPFSEKSIWVGPPHASEAAYAQAKRAMLAQLEACSTQYGLRYAYPILTNMYGPGDRFNIAHGHVIPSLIAKFHSAMNDGGPVIVWGSGTAERDFMYADDAARALIQVAEEHEGPINVATGVVQPIRTVVDVLHDYIPGVEVRWDATKPDGQAERRYDTGLLRGLGFQPEVDLRSGLRRSFDWYAEHYPAVRR